MLIFSHAQIRSADEFTIRHEPIASIDLMERAALKCLDFISEKWDEGEPVVICCGPGNNGGDGLALARLLNQKKYTVSVFLFGEKFSADNLVNQKRLAEAGIPIKTHQEFKRENLHQVLVVDALFGTGLSRKPDGMFESVIDFINSSEAAVISIDLPSGMGEKESWNTGKIIQADYTLTFQFPKMEFLLPESGIFAGEWYVMDIGLMEDAFRNEKPVAYYVQREMITPFFSKRPKFSHKGSNGHACIIGGSYGKIGAVSLAAKACLVSGAGLTTVMVPDCGYSIIQSSVPEAMVAKTKGENFLEEINIKELNYSCIGIGPGMGTAGDTALMVKNCIQNANCPMILDADALNILSENKTWLSFLPTESILTPHQGEFRRLVGKWDSSYEMIQKQKELAFKFQCYVILKGAYTSIATPGGNLYFNSTGNPGLAKGGSGDTLTGILTALMAQGFSALETCLAGVYLHGLAADLAVATIHENSLTASNVINHLSDGFREIYS